MPARRANVRRKDRAISRELLPKAERLLELKDAHRHANRGGASTFYEDGRHHELVDLLPVVHLALGIKPWDDGYEMLRGALAAEGSPHAR
jgi:hypothetical protein